MIEYTISINNGNEYFDTEGKTITVNESVKTADETALAREISHANPLIPEQVARDVLENFCKAAVNIMSMGFAIQMKSGNDVALRIYPDIHVKGGNINLKRAKELDPSVTEITRDNASSLVQKAGITVRVRTEAEQRFTDMLKEMRVSTNCSGITERDKVTRTTGGEENVEPVDVSTNEPADVSNGGGGSSDQPGGMD